MKTLRFYFAGLIAGLILSVGGEVRGQAIVFSDDFSTNQSATWTTSGAIGASAWTVTRSGADWGARRNTSSAQLELTNDASASGNVNGWVFASTTTSSFSAPYNSTLSSNTGVVTWTFNIRQIRTDPAGYGAGSYGAAFILAGSSSTAATAGSGYAIVYGQSGSTDPVRLATYNNGLQGTLTSIIASNTSGLTDFGADYISIKVTYTPSSNTWELFLRNDGGSAFADPEGGSLTSQGTVVNSTYTGTSLGYMGAYWQGSTGGSQTAFFDNVKATVASSATPPTVTTSAASGITSSSATLNGNITATGGADASERGFYYSTTSGFADGTGTKISSTGTYGTGTFSETPTGLTASTTYYFKAFATNSAGTSYGSQQSFTTSAASCTPQTITFGALAAKTYGDATFSLTATASSGLTVSYASSNTAVATVSGSTVTIVGLGSTDITASQAGNATYCAATSVIQALTVNAKALTVTGAAATSKAYDGTTDAAITGSLSGVIGGDAVTLNGTGTFASANVGTGISVTSTSTLGGADASKYTLTQPTGLTANISKADQTITLAATDSKNVGAADYTLAASSPTSATNALSYLSSNTAVATIHATTGLVHIVAAGTTVFTVSQGGNSNYNAATDATQTLTVVSGPCLSENFAVAATPSGWTATNVSWTESTGKASFNATTGELVTVSVSNPVELRFNLARTTNTAAKILYVKVSTTSQSSGFTTVATYDHSNTTSGGTVACTVDLSAYTSNAILYIKFEKSSSTTSPWRLDDVEVTCGASSSVADPTGVTATAASSAQINLAYTLNANSDDVVIAWNSSNTFGTPTGTYSASDPITGGGTVLYKGSNTSFSHTSLTASTQYFYKIWSVDGSNIYSNGVETNATTPKEAPSNHVTGFTATPASSSSITISWTDASGGTQPDGYILKGSTVNSFTDPINGTDPAEDTDLSDGSALVKKAQGVQSHTFTGLTSLTAYYFKIWPYTNTGTNILFKTDGTVPTATANTYGANYYRSKQSGLWSDASSWESSPDNSIWSDASSAPTYSDNTVTIRNSHAIEVTANVTVDQVVIQSGGTLNHTGGTLTINNGTDEDIRIENGGIFRLGVNTQTYSSGATTLVQGGGILRIAAGSLTGAGSGMNSAAYVYENNAIAEYTLTSAFSSSNVIFFPNVDANTIPIFRISSTMVATVGASNPTTINGILDVTGSVSWANAGIKTFRNGITGTGTLVQASTSGQFQISGTTAVLGGSGIINLSTGGLQVNSGSTVTLSSDKTISGGALTNSGTINLNDFELIMEPTASVAGTGVFQSGSNEDGTINGSKDFASTAVSAQNIGNLGAVISFDNSQNITLSVKRGHKRRFNPKNNKYGIGRYYTIQTTGNNTGLNATLVFHYLESELDGQDETKLHLYRSTDGGLTWSRVPTVRDSEANTLTVNGLNGFSIWTASDEDNPLPVELLSFTGRRDANHVELSWQTATETNNAGFEVQRSADAQDFDVLGFVAGAGNSNMLQTYRFADDNPPSSLAYYRLKQIDHDGAYEYSQVISVKSAGSAFSISQPSISNGVLSFALSGIEGNVVVHLMDISGRMLLNRELIADAGQAFIQLPNAAGGLYLLRIISPQGNQSIKFIAE